MRNAGGFAPRPPVAATHASNSGILMRLLLLLPVALLLLRPTSAAAQANADIELVESIPVETVLDNPDIRDASAVWKEMIRSAKTSLDIEEFYVSDKAGEPLEDILAEIIAAGARGVSVRLLVDARMYKTYPESVTRLGQSKNIAEIGRASCRERV